MKKSQKEIKEAAVKLLGIAGRDPQIASQLRNECLCWSDNSTSDLYETLDYLKNKDLREYELFASSIVYRANIC